MNTQNIAEQWEQWERQQAAFRAVNPKRLPHYHGRRGQEAWSQYEHPAGDPEVGHLPCWCDCEPR